MHFVPSQHCTACSVPFLLTRSFAAQQRSFAQRLNSSSHTHIQTPLFSLANLCLTSERPSQSRRAVPCLVECGCNRPTYPVSIYHTLACALLPALFLCTLCNCLSRLCRREISSPRKLAPRSLACSVLVRLHEFPRNYIRVRFTPLDSRPPHACRTWFRDHCTVLASPRSLAHCLVSPWTPLQLSMP